VVLEPVGYDIAGELQALQSGQIDALAIPFSVSTRINVILGANLRCISCEGGTPVPGTGLVVSEALLNDSPEVVEGLGRAMAKASHFALSSPEAAEAVLTEALPEDWADPESTRAVLQATLDLTEPREAGYGATDMEAWQNQMDLMLLSDTLTGLSAPIDLEALVRTDFVEAFNDFDQAAIEEQAESMAG
jgi:NitT/TauT family transport system substrate-binding protein